MVELNSAINWLDLTDIDNSFYNIEYYVYIEYDVTIE